MIHNEDRPVALITGAAKRIGACIAQTLHQHGWNIIIHCHRSTSAANQLAQQLEKARINSAYVITADLNRMDDVCYLAEAALTPWGKINALINNASSFFATPLSDASEAQWENLFSSNLKSPFFLSQKIWPELKKTRGCIINITDIFAERPMKEHSIYSIAKAGNSMMTKCLALEMAPDVRVNGIAPGAILWPADTDLDEMTQNQKREAIPLKDLGGPHVIANAVKFLLEESPYTTGHILTVDGGRSLKQ